jgi:hypothetical protein
MNGMGQAIPRIPNRRRKALDITVVGCENTVHGSLQNSIKSMAMFNIIVLPYLFL